MPTGAGCAATAPAGPHRAVAIVQPLDVTAAGHLPIRGLQQFRHLVPVDVAGVQARIVRPEDLVIYKMVAARPRDLDDVENLLVVHGRTMNLRRVKSVVAEFAAVLEDEERPAILDRLLRKAGLG